MGIDPDVLEVIKSLTEALQRLEARIEALELSGVKGWEPVEYTVKLSDGSERVFKRST